jgi:GST-like protein
MLDLYYWPTANGIKVPILLLELGVPFRPQPLNIRLGEHQTGAFRLLSPDGRIPALLDHAPVSGETPVTVFESAAILLYLADKHGRFLPAVSAARSVVVEWLFWHAAHVVPAFGFYQKLQEQIDPAQAAAFIAAARLEVARLYQVLEQRLAQVDFLAGEYSVADIAMFPWIQPRRQGQLLSDYPYLARWHGRVAARPAVQQAYAAGRQLAPAEKSLADWR